MSARGAELQPNGRRELRPPGDDVASHEGIVEGLKDQRRAGDFPQVLSCSLPPRSSGRHLRNPCSGAVTWLVEAVKAALAPHRIQVERPGSILELAEDGATQIGDEVTPVHAREGPARADPRRAASRKGTEIAARRGDLRVRAAFGQPLQQDIAPEGEAHHRERRRWTPVAQQAHDMPEVARFAGVVRAQEPIRLSAAPPEVHDHALKAPPDEGAQQAAYVR